MTTTTVLVLGLAGLCVSSGTSRALAQQPVPAARGRDSGQTPAAARPSPAITAAQLEARGLYGQAHGLYRKSQFQSAIALCEKSYRLDPAYDKNLVLWSGCTHALGDTAATIGLLMQAVEQRPEDFDLMLHLAGLQRSAGRLEEALKVVQHVESRVGRTARVLRALAAVLADLDRLEEAEAVTSELKTLDPKDVPARVLLATVLERRGLTEQAIREWRDLTYLCREAPSYGIRVGELLRAQGKVEAAARELEGLCRLFPDDIPLRECLVDLYRTHLVDDERRTGHENRLKEIQGSGR